MVKKCLVLLIIPVLLFATELTQTYTFTQPKIDGDQLTMEGCQPSYDAFAPRLAIKPVSLLLPAGQVAVSFDVAYGEPVKLKNSQYIAPFLPGGIISKPPPADYYTKTAGVYSVDAFLPAEIKSPKFFTQYRYGHSIFSANLRPVQYNAVTGEVQFYQSITVKVTTAKAKNSQMPFRFSPFIKSQLALEVDNPEALEGIPYTIRDADDYDYAIITTNALKNSWDSFVAFNKRRGLKSKIHAIEEINSSSSGSKPEDKLKNFLIKQYKDHKITYVMLGGDDNFGTNRKPLSTAITHKGYSAAFKDYGTDPISDKDIAADMFYETLDGQELKDLEWELYAARFPADNATELKRMIDKTIAYSEKPVNSALKKSVLAGEKLWANIHGGTCYGIDCMKLLKGKSTKYYETNCFDNSWSHTELKERSSSWTKNRLIGLMNDGIHIVNHLGHSNNFMIMKMYKQYNDVQKLTNTAYWIGFTEGCYCGCWDNRKISFNASINTGHYNHSSQDCIAEEFTVGTSKGAVAFVSNTRFGLGDNGRASREGTDGSSIRIQRFFWDGLFDKKMHHIAVMLAYSKWINKTPILNTNVNAEPYFGQLTYCAYQVNCLGDPALSVWTSTPKTFTELPAYSIKNKVFEMDTKNPYTWVALLDKDDKIIASQQSGTDGKIKIEDLPLVDYLTKNPRADLKVNIKAHNYKPFSGDVTAIALNRISALQNLSVVSAHNKVKINYSIPQASRVSISLFNAKGSELKSVVKGLQSGGTYSLQVKTDDLSSGIYYVRAAINNAQVTEKIMVTK